MKRFHHRHRSRPGRCTHLAPEPLDRRLAPSGLVLVGPLPPIPDDVFAPPPEVLVPDMEPDVPKPGPEPLLPLTDDDILPFVPLPPFIPGPPGPG